MTEIDRLEKEIEEKKRKIEALKAAKSVLTPERELAIALHGKLCHHNHTDGCGWYYEMHDEMHNWNGRNHEEYLQRAQNLISTGVSINDIIKIVEKL